MLVLSRLVGEEIIVGDNIRVVIVGIKDGNKVRLGIEAPSNVPVHRKEVYDAIQAARMPQETPAPQPYVADLPNASAALRAAIEEEGT